MATYGITFYAMQGETILEHHEISPYDFTFVCEDIYDLAEAAEAAQMELGFALETYESEVFEVIRCNGLWLEHKWTTNAWEPWEPWQG